MRNLFAVFRNLLPGKTSRKPAEPPRPRVVLPLASSAERYAAEPAPEKGGGPAGLTVELPLSSVVCLLPDHLRCRVLAEALDSESIAIPLQQVLPQLAQGDVRISFGQLRQAAPQVFTPEADEDDTLVQLPFGELASRCDPALMNYYEQLQGGPVAQSRTAQSDHHSAVVAPDPRARPNLVAASRLRASKTLADASARSNGSADGATLAPMGRSTVPLPNRSAAPVLSPSPAPSLSAEPAEPASQPEVLLVDLWPLTEKWPEAARSELEQLNLVQAQVALPKPLVSAGLKQGRVTFRWDALRSWLQPATDWVSSIPDETELELPLQIIAPLFLAAQRELNKPRPKVQFDEEIPDVFGMVQSAPNASEAGGTQSAGRFALEAAPAPARTAEAEEPASTPEQLVGRAVGLKGVAGALVTLPDGLLVASRFPEHRDPHKVAAFLPQIFTRLAQYTEQLEMGELATLEFLVGEVPWKAFRFRQVLFVVFGRRGEALPSSELGRLAAELDNH